MSPPRGSLVDPLSQSKPLLTTSVAVQGATPAKRGCLHWHRKCQPLSGSLGDIEPSREQEVGFTHTPRKRSRL